MRRSRVVASACAAALLATSLAAPASANLSKRQKAEAAFRGATLLCGKGGLFAIYPRICYKIFDIADKIAGR